MRGFGAAGDALFLHLGVGFTARPVCEKRTVHL